MNGGEAGGARLLSLARREIEEQMLPQLSGDARYRARLVLNALALAEAELRQGGRQGAEARERLSGLLAFETKADGSAPDDLERSIQEQIRQGARDGDVALHEALLAVTEARLRALDAGP
ncbi:DUF6285 domain-containing protein [Pelagibius sp.]|uniref:DUF6285 domain-containing protein n=1 Tax=Pelagibius sp. TaxID=1931238 RepID=UPI003B509EFB